MRGLVLWVLLLLEAPGASDAFTRPMTGRPKGRTVLCQQQQEGTERKEVLVVGGGVGGLSLAGRIARSRPGWRVQVLEKNDKVGGRMDELVTASGFRFDLGPSLLLAPDVYEEAFRSLGSDVRDFTELLRVERAYRVFLRDNRSCVLSSDLHEMREELEGLEEGSFLQLLRYLREAGVNYEEGFRSRPFLSKDNSLLDYVNLENVKLLQKFDPSNLFVSHKQKLSSYFRSEDIHDLLSFQDLYVGLAPHTAPAIFSLLQYLELVRGVWYPRHGFSRIRQGLEEAAARAGVTVRRGAKVKQIQVDESRRATGVELEGGEVLRADIVVSNVDVPTSYEDLLRRDVSPAERERITGMSMSSSTLAFYWPVKRRISELEHHNIFISPLGEKSWDMIFQGDGQLPAAPSFYVCSSSKTDASAAPAGCENLMILVPCGCIPRGDVKIDWAELTQRARRLVLERMRQCGIDLESDVLWEEEFVLTPPEWRERYGLYRGASFGLAHPLSQLVLLRPANRHGDVKNLYFVGASTTPGNGVPLVLTGARMCTERILAEWS